MEDNISALRSELDTLLKEYRKNRSQVINRQILREKVRDYVKKYFSQYRLEVLRQHNNEDHLRPIDDGMQNLISYCNARTLRSKYLKEIKALKKALDNWEIVSLNAKPSISDIIRGTQSKQDSTIINTLR